MKRKVVMVGALVLALGALGGGVAAASSSGSAGSGTNDAGETDVAITGAELATRLWPTWARAR